MLARYRGCRCTVLGSAGLLIWGKHRGVNCMLPSIVWTVGGCSCTHLHKQGNECTGSRLWVGWGPAQVNRVSFHHPLWLLQYTVHLLPLPPTSSLSLLISSFFKPTVLLIIYKLHLLLPYLPLNLVHMSFTTLLHLPPSFPLCRRMLGLWLWKSDILTTRLDLDYVSARSHPQLGSISSTTRLNLIHNSARSHPQLG